MLKQLYIFFFFFTSSVFYPQKQFNADSILQSNKSNLYQLIYKKLENSQSNSIKQTEDLIDKTPTTDTNYYRINYKPYLKPEIIEGYFLFEYYVDVKPQPTKDEHILIVPNNRFLPTEGKGVVALNKSLKYPLFSLISGYIFLRDLKAIFFKQGVSKEKLIEYTKIKYFDYDPYDILVTSDNKVFFKSSTNYPFKLVITDSFCVTISYDKRTNSWTERIETKK